MKKLNIIEETTGRGYEQMALVSLSPDGIPTVSTVPSLSLVLQAEAVFALHLLAFH